MQTMSCVADLIIINTGKKNNIPYPHRSPKIVSRENTKALWTGYIFGGSLAWQKLSASSAADATIGSHCYKSEIGIRHQCIKL